MDKSQKFNTLQVNKLKTKNLDYSYSNNIIYINNLNAQSIVLNSSYSNYYLVTQDNNMDIIIKLNDGIVGTKFRILITNIQKTLTIQCNHTSSKFSGTLNINNTNLYTNNESLANNLQKKYTISTNITNTLYISKTDMGLYNGGYIDLLYLGTMYCNKRNSLNSAESTDMCYWYVSGELIGKIKLPITIENKNLVNIYEGSSFVNMLTTQNTNIGITTNLDSIYNNIGQIEASNQIITRYRDSTDSRIVISEQNILTIYLNTSDSIEYIEYVTTESPIDNIIYYNKFIDNNICIFLDLYYNVKIKRTSDNVELYNMNTYDSSIEQKSTTYNIKICNSLLDETVPETYIDLKNKNNSTDTTQSFIKDFVSDNNYNIKEIYNTNIKKYDKLNIIKYKITKYENTSGISTNTNIIIGYFNVTSIKSYNNSVDINNNLPNLLFGNYNIFRNRNNIII